MIDLQSLIPGTQHFTWKEALYLPQWDICVYPPDNVAKNIIHFANKVLQPARNLIGLPFIITPYHSFYRPPEYNKLVKGSKNSAHIEGLALDFSVLTMTPEQVRQKLMPFLGVWGARMELGTKSWVHIDGRKRAPGEPTTFYP